MADNARTISAEMPKIACPGAKLPVLKGQIERCDRFAENNRRSTLVRASLEQSDGGDHLTAESPRIIAGPPSKTAMNN
ncbi:hypothetical protein [Kitasatospora sp. NPDC001547]|uniref:hypothetical protein n=1 Tax=Kitasatospora sp. NPDC001547 TaxID=3364015 RepID=UPI0036C84C06